MTTPRLRHIFAVGSFLLFALFFAGAGWAQQPANAAALDPGAYTAELSQCSNAIAALRQNPAGIAQFRKSLPAQWKVRIDGRTFRVPTAWLDSALAQIEAHPEKAQGKWREIEDRLDLLRAQSVAMESSAIAPSSEQAREKLDAIFRRREFRGLAGPGPITLWWDRLTSWIDHLIARLFSWLHLGALSGNLLAYALIAVALFFLSLWGWRVLAGRERKESEVAEWKPGAAGARAWAADALAAAERGEFREAIRCAYWAAVRHMEEQGIFPSDRSRTPRELLRAMMPGSKNRAPFRELTQSFEMVWYGYRSPSRADWENMKMQMERIGCLGVSTPQIAGS